MELNRDLELNKKTQTNTTTSGNPEAEINQIINEIQAAMKAQDIEKIMSFYAPDIVAFDVSGPTQYEGKEKYKKSWLEAFEMCGDEKGQNDKWLITHEQYSFPVDFETGKALMNQKPEDIKVLH